MKIEVLEVDQWTSTGNIAGRPWADLKAEGIDGVSGGDSEAIRHIFGGDWRFYEVDEGAEPGTARVWFRNVNGVAERWRYNFDSSD